MAFGRIQTAGDPASGLARQFEEDHSVLPERCPELIGDELQLIQFGGMPKDAKPFRGVGSGVIELAIRYATDAYRTVVAVQLGPKIYVLHVFQKKSRRGIATSKHDVDLIQQRYREAEELASDEQ